MGGFLSRSRRREVNEETSSRLESEAEVKPGQNQYVGRDLRHRHSAELISFCFIFNYRIEVNRHKKQVSESQSSAEEITVGVDPIEECELSE